VIVQEVGSGGPAPVASARGEGREGGVHPREQGGAGTSRGSRAAGGELQPARLWPAGERLSHVLRAVAAAAGHRDLEVRAAEERVARPGGELYVGLSPGAPERQVQLPGSEGEQPRRDLLGKTIRVTGSFIRFAREDPRRLVLPVTVTGGAAEHRDDHVRTEAADYGHHIRQQLFAGPMPEGLVGIARET